MQKKELKLNFGVEFADLYDVSGLKKVHLRFEEFFQQKDLDLYEKFSCDKGSESIIAASKVLEEFLVTLFDIEKENSELKKDHEKWQKVAHAKREFVQRIVSKKYKELPFAIDGATLLKELGCKENEVNEVEFFLARKILTVLDGDIDEDLYKKLSLYAVYALYDEKGRRFHGDGSLFILPQKIDPDNLVGSPEFKGRKGFDLTDVGFLRNRVVSEAKYCIFCHKQGKDSCRTGLKQHQGCPLDQKISEMNLLKSQGFSIASMAVAAIDNPLMAGTGHRICNDCMKACIFQKQDPVNIPQVESENLKDILRLPWGFEIYSLMTRWNPLKNGEELPLENSGKRVLVAGLGPAGYVLAHYLLNCGHDVVGIDGLKIEPINPVVCGIDPNGNRVDFEPIQYIDEIYQPLSTRLIHGFGGVAEYGITSRWDKNFLTIIRLLLERRCNFRMFGGIRFGSSIDEKMAFEEYGFDHIALCLGAGRPNIIDLKNNFAKGVRLASDFLMALQLTGAFKRDLFTNLQIRVPILVVGGGLTAVDTACEAQAYYILQIEKFAEKFAILRDKYGKDFVFSQFNEEEKTVASEFLRHYDELQEIGRHEFAKKYRAKIIYRKKIQDSPAYRLNHEELIKAFEQGIEFIEEKRPQEVILDEFGHVRGLKCKDGEVFACRSLLVAAGTVPNVSVKVEDGLDFELEGKYFKQKDGFLTKEKVSFFGDLHPKFEGNVVKAMASAKDGYKQVDEVLRSSLGANFEGFFAKINHDFAVKIAKVDKISPYSFEIYVKAPLLAKKAEVGHIFRLQNYHIFADVVEGQRMAMEGVTVTALAVDRDEGVIKAIVLSYGGSTSLIGNFKAGEPCVFMGPSGKPTDLAQNETVLLIGGGRGNMPLTEIGLALKERGCRVIFCAGYRKKEFVQRQERMRQACDELIYAVEEGVDFAFKGNVVEALRDYFGRNPCAIDRVFVIGGDKMMAEIARVRREGEIKEIADAKIAIASLNASMQCMMKGVCSQCLQKRVGADGEVEYFYACADQDQDMDKLDFSHLQARCDQNSTQEKMTRMWISYLGTPKG